MIENEYLPYALSIGVPYEIFGTLNPRKLKAFTEAYKLRQKSIDEMNWMLGAYVANAFGVVLSNAFSKNGAKKAEYLKEPFLRAQQSNPENLTEEEKLQQVKNIFACLSVRKTNFDLAKREEEGNS